MALLPPVMRQLRALRHDASHRTSAFGPLHAAAAGPLEPLAMAAHVALKRLRHGTDLFGRVEVELSSRCNLGCSYCPVSRSPRPEGELPTELFLGLVQQLAQLRFSGILSPHLYNEPLLDQRLEHLLQQAHRQLPRATIVLFTNGTLLTPRRLRALLQAGVSRLVLAQHGEQSRAALQRLWPALTPAERRHLQPVLPTGARSRLFNRGGLVAHLPPSAMKRCFMATHFLSVSYRGDVVLCCNDYLGQHSFGNLAREPLLQIWNAAPYRRLRHDLRHGRLQLDLCRRCVGLLPADDQAPPPGRG